KSTPSTYSSATGAAPLDSPLAKLLRRESLLLTCTITSSTSTSSTSITSTSSTSTSSYNTSSTSTSSSATGAAPPDSPLVKLPWRESLLPTRLPLTSTPRVSSR
ncbi:unnamed protein product, partial [Closterium sp. NIES-54]